MADMEPAPTLVFLDKVDFQYSDGTRAVRQVTLQIDQGEFIALVGRNGCGKSTLCRLTNGLLRPSSGRVLVEGVDTRTPGSERFVRATVSMVFQVPDNQIVATVVEQDVAFGPENLGVPQPELQARVRDALETVGLWGHRHRPPHLLSEGEKQLVAIAGALAMKPRCLILDEATSMLNPTARKRVLDVAQRVHASGVTVIMATHDMSEARLVDRIVALDGGSVVFDGDPANLFADPDRVRSLGLSLPPAALLAHELRKRHFDLPVELLGPEEVAEALRRVLAA